MKDEASALMRRGIEAGVFSIFVNGTIPKYVWSVSRAGEVFEAKSHPGHERVFHGYRLGDDDDMKAIILEEWAKRCPKG